MLKHGNLRILVAISLSYSPDGLIVSQRDRTLVLSLWLGIFTYSIVDGSAFCLTRDGQCRTIDCEGRIADGER